ncbi:phosphopantetheine-binding protein [Streptomyces ferrugineus]|uniref:Phosphopantetheine-binding protein n=2 Tax=Streptomyces ferrugineus TaxID=1413221 RepID=A0A7M2SYG1_9ACTN|nr:phosphopantetheine-binding protein [Streptomyces ferrugineus]
MPRGTSVATVKVPDSFKGVLLVHLPYAEGELLSLGLDSMGVVQPLAALEDHSYVDFPDEALNEETFATVGSLWSTVAALVEPVESGEA